VIGFAVVAYFAVLIYRIYADRRHATVPTLFGEDPHPASPAARDLAEDAERRRREHEEAQLRAERQKAAAHAAAGGHDTHGHDAHTKTGKGGHA
jgi:hypothetical protein